MNPYEIEKRSYEIVRSYLPRDIFRDEDEYELAVRIAHSTADIELAKSLVIHEKFIQSSLYAIERGLPIFVDVEMARCGLLNYSSPLGIEIICAVLRQDVVEEAKKEGITRSAMAVRKVLSEVEVGLVVCGNSPTFLLELIDIVENGRGFIPKSIIALPVGFVLAEDAKRKLAEKKNFPVPFLTNLSPRGGTPPAVSAAIFLLNKVRSKRGISSSYGQHSA